MVGRRIRRAADGLRPRPARAAAATGDCVAVERRRICGCNV